jgi:hypothetical protein
MEYERIDLISLFDYSFQHYMVSDADLRRLGDAPGEDLEQLEVKEKQKALEKLGALEELYARSSGWLFYGDLRRDLQRFCFLPSEYLTNSKGSSMIVSPKYGAGVLSVWQTITDGTEPLMVKNRPIDAYKPEHEFIRLKLKGATGGRREYPFLAIRALTDDLDTFCKDNALLLGQVLTSNQEYEEDKYLEEYVDAKHNISRRKYERLYIRWTDALAVYTNRLDECEYELALCRAVQLFENCILLRRLLDNADERMAEVSPTLALYRPRPWAVQQILQSVRDFESQFVDSPPTQSLEADRLLTATYKEFGIDERFKAVIRGCDLMVKRYEWAKTELYVLIAVVAYLLDKLGVYAPLADWLRLAFRDLRKVL